MDRPRAVRGLAGLPACAWVAFVVSACVGDEPGGGPAAADGDAVVRRDSAGIEIVESSAPRWGGAEGWRVAGEPVLDLTATGSGPSHEFDGVEDVTRLSDGTIVVAMPRELRFYARDGTHLASVGRHGEGPGEFQRLTDVVVLTGDSVLAFDYWLRRATVFGPDREVARLFSVGLGYVRQDIHAVDDSTLLVRQPDPPLMQEGEPELGLRRPPVALVRLARDGRVLDTISVAPGHESVLMFTDRGTLADARAVFGRDHHVAVGDGRVFAGSAGELAYRVLDPGGALRRVVRVPDHPLELPPGLLEAELSVRLGPDPSPATRRHYGRIPVPDRRPAYADLLVDPTGAVWLQEHVGELVGYTSTEPRRWQVFAPDGAWLGAVELPGRFTVHDVGTDEVLGVRLDALDVERPQVLRLHR